MPITMRPPLNASSAARSRFAAGAELELLLEGADDEGLEARQQPRVVVVVEVQPLAHEPERRHRSEEESAVEVFDPAAVPDEVIDELR